MPMPTTQHERLATLTAHFATEITLDDWTWSSLYEYATGDVPEPEQIAEITHLRAVSPEGWASTNIALLAHLTDGRSATCVAWSDTTGFGCQQGVDWRINDTREQAIAMSLDKESRSHLGLTLPNDQQPT
ncbi:hypothetical protein [Streptomyces sp. CC208A]|uniref:hypothetical protein n=1 Tax=Streptomyces sp. CC208A TaxID=3044573 RepID=UPI0024A7BF34|nr:hypothetical protein [Streptomyces sp. CC208A]